MRLLLQTILRRARNFLAGLQERRRLQSVAWHVARHEPRQTPLALHQPVVFFNASTRLNGLSQNAAFSLLAAWAVRLSGTPVVHFVCQKGMSRCVLGTRRDDFSSPMPCDTCLRLSRRLYAGADVHSFNFQRDDSLASAIQELDLPGLAAFEYPVPRDWQFSTSACPLGAMVLPSIRWVLRRHTLSDDAPTRVLFREYILSAWNVAHEFAILAAGSKPRAVVVFNGQFFPEAAVRWVCIQGNLRVITHEVAIQPLTGFFTHAQATAYPIHIPEAFNLSSEQNARLDTYLEKRFQGKFSMAGIRFWPEMQGLNAEFLTRAAQFKQIVPIFTNVIFDTSQPHANAVFPDMFAWLDLVLEVIQAHPETLFIIRAHPDESRPGKASRESVADWVIQTRILELPNVVFVPPDEYVSSYEMIQRAKFVMVYNSTIGIEASIMGASVLCAGKARFTQYPTVFFPLSIAEYRVQLENFLATENIQTLPEHQRQARRFLYYQLYRTSLPFDVFLSPSDIQGYVRLKGFDWRMLLPDTSPAVRALLDGILHGDEFLMKE